MCYPDPPVAAALHPNVISEWRQYKIQHSSARQFRVRYGNLYWKADPANLARRVTRFRRRSGSTTAPGPSTGPPTYAGTATTESVIPTSRPPSEGCNASVRAPNRQDSDQ